MPVEQNSGCARHVKPLSDDHRPAGCLYQPHLQPGALHHIGNICGDLAYPYSERADTWLAHIGDQAIEKLLPVAFNRGEHPAKLRRIMHVVGLLPLCSTCKERISPRVTFFQAERRLCCSANSYLLAKTRSPQK